MASVTSTTVSLGELLRQIASQRRPNLVNLDPHVFPKNVGPLPGEVIEITGDSNTGKTVLLAEFMARALLPTKCGGQQSNVVFLETEINYQLFSLVGIMERIIHEHHPNCSESEMLDIIYQALEHLETLTCYTRDDFDMAVHSLENMFLQNTQISLLVLDSVTTFYWQDVDAGRMPSLNHYTKSLLDRLRKFTDTHGAVLAYTRPTYFRSKNITDSGDGPNDENGEFDYQFELVFDEEVKNGASEFVNFIAKLRIVKLHEEIQRNFTIGALGFQWKSSPTADMMNLK